MIVLVREDAEVHLRALQAMTSSSCRNGGLEASHIEASVRQSVQTTAAPMHIGLGTASNSV
jgi:hypothetical protein